jgi:hypothetical protein
MRTIGREIQKLEQMLELSLDRFGQKQSCQIQDIQRFVVQTLSYEHEYVDKERLKGRGREKLTSPRVVVFQEAVEFSVSAED